jgi:hypothetical protein
LEQHHSLISNGWRSSDVSFKKIENAVNSKDHTTLAAERAAGRNT